MKRSGIRYCRAAKLKQLPGSSKKRSALAGWHLPDPLYMPILQCQHILVRLAFSATGADCGACSTEVESYEKAKNQAVIFFLDLGYEPEEAAVLQMRATLTSDLRAFIEQEKLTQAAAAARLDIAPSRVSDLVRGKWEKFNLEMLITLEARLGL